jgi:hypothetical protein
MDQEQKDNKIGFKSIILFKDETLGIGAYIWISMQGKV